MAYNPPIKRQSPFINQPLRWASPPGVGEAGAVPGPLPTGQGGFPAGSLSSFTLGSRGTGILGTAWPVLVRVATQKFQQPVAILGVSLAASIVNASATETAVIGIHKDVGASLSMAAGTELYAEYTVEQALSHSIRTGTSFTDNLAPYFGSNEAMAIYVLMRAAGCAYTAIMTVRYVVLP